MEGIIYYNIGLKCIVRLAVSILTLIKNVKKDITILSDSNGYSECEKIAKHFGVNIVNADFPSGQGKNYPLLNKCRINIVTPYERSIFLDSDTIILKDFSEVFDLIEPNEFVVTQMCKWESTGRRYRPRIAAWENKIHNETMLHAFDEKKAVNIGFYGFMKNAKIFNNWFSLAVKNRNSFIPDEISCQILLGHFKHLVIGSEYNTSCKHEVVTENTRTLHFHGRKHCRIENGKYLYNSNLWYDEFDKLRGNDFIEENIKNDRHLLRYIPDL